MFKIKNFKVELKDLLTSVSALGVLTGFILSLCTKKKTAPAIVFVLSFAGLIAGLGMESGLIPTPPCCKKLDIDVEADPEEGEDADECAEECDESAEGEEPAEAECAAENAEAAE